MLVHKNEQLELDLFFEDDSQLNLFTKKEFDALINTRKLKDKKNKKKGVKDEPTIE